MPLSLCGRAAQGRARRRSDAARPRRERSRRSGCDRRRRRARPCPRARGSPAARSGGTTSSASMFSIQSCRHSRLRRSASAGHSPGRRARRRARPRSAATACVPSVECESMTTMSSLRLRTAAIVGRCGPPRSCDDEDGEGDGALRGHVSIRCAAIATSGRPLQGPDWPVVVARRRARRPKRRRPAPPEPRKQMRCLGIGYLTKRLGLNENHKADTTSRTGGIDAAPSWMLPCRP